jgi:hypothetical protein
MARDKTRRGSPEAIAKRRAARSLNRIFDQGPSGPSIDRRSLRRKKRLIQELKEGRRGEPLKAHEILGHVTELLAFGESMGSIRKLKPRIPPVPPLNAETVSTIRATQESYQFDPRAWKLLGVDIEEIAGDGSPAAKSTPRRAARKKATRKKR